MILINYKIFLYNIYYIKMSYLSNLSDDNKKILLLIVGLIIVGFIYMQYKKKEQLEEQEKPNAAEAALDQFKKTFNLY
jgi:hypothetical protein